MSEHCCEPSFTPSPGPRFLLPVLGLFLSAISMFFAMPKMFGVNAQPWFFGASFLSSLLVTAGLGWRFWFAIPRLFWKPGMNTLVGLGIAAAYALSFWQWSRGHVEQIYFDSAAFIASFVLLGQQVERWIYKRVEDQIPNWMGFLPKTAQLLDEGSQQEISIDEIQVGQKLLIRPGERVPVDAILLSERAELDESLVTGESKPVERQKNGRLQQGSLNLSQPIEVEVLRVSSESFYRQLATHVEKSLKARSELQSRVDRWAGILTPLVVLISIASAVYWGWYLKNYEMMVSAGVSVLVVACPCVLGMATPISLFVGVIRAARHGVLLKSPDVIDKIQDINIVAFDKTGTLTTGRPIVDQIYSIENVAQKDVLQLAASIEQKSEHPFAKAILEKNVEKLLPVSEVQVASGKGILGRVEKDKKSVEVCIGNIVWLFENGVESTEIPENLRWEAEGASGSVLWLAVDRKVMGVLVLSDQVREGARDLVESLKNEKYEVGLITGDAENVARTLAKDLKLQFFHYGVIPEEKAMIVRRLSEKKKKGIDVIFPKVAYIGDGINDGPAIAAAHLGVALGSGTALAQSSAQVILSSNRLDSVRKMFEVLKETSGLLSQNLWLASIYNLIAIPVAAGALYPAFGFQLNPGLAALAMSLSSVSLVGNSLRALRR